MAITAVVSALDRDVTSKRVNRGTLTLTSTYLTGGFAVTPGLFGLHRLDSLVIDAVGGRSLIYNKATGKVIAYQSAGFTPAGTNDAPAFTGSALAAHRHVLHFQTSVAANAVTAAANSLRTAAAAFDVAGVANSSGEGGVVDVTGGTPAGTVAAPTFTGTAVAAAGLLEVANGTSLSTTVAYFVAVGT